MSTTVWGWAFRDEQTQPGSSTIGILVKGTQMFRFIKISMVLWGGVSVRGYARPRRAHNPESGKTSRQRQHLLIMLQPHWSFCNCRFLPTPGNPHLLFPQRHMLFPLILTLYSHTSSSLGTNTSQRGLPWVNPPNLNDDSSVAFFPLLFSFPL